MYSNEEDKNGSESGKERKSGDGVTKRALKLDFDWRVLCYFCCEGEAFPWLTCLLCCFRQFFIIYS